MLQPQFTIKNHVIMLHVFRVTITHAYVKRRVLSCRLVMACFPEDMFCTFLRLYTIKSNIYLSYIMSTTQMIIKADFGRKKTHIFRMKK